MVFLSHTMIPMKPTEDLDYAGPLVPLDAGIRPTMPDFRLEVLEVRGDIAARVRTVERLLTHQLNRAHRVAIGERPYARPWHDALVTWNCEPNEFLDIIEHTSQRGIDLSGVARSVHDLCLATMLASGCTVWAKFAHEDRHTDRTAVRTSARTVGRNLRPSTHSHRISTRDRSPTIAPWKSGLVSAAATESGNEQSDRLIVGVGSLHGSSDPTLALAYIRGALHTCETVVRRAPFLDGLDETSRKHARL